MKLSEENRANIEDLLQALRRPLSKAQCAEEVRKTIDKHYGEPVLGTLSGVIGDLECHLGIFQSKTSQCEAKDSNLSFEKGLRYLTQSLREIKKGEVENIPPTLYFVQQKWIFIDDEKIEITLLRSSDWNYRLLKATGTNDYFFSLLLNRSAAYWNQLIKVDEALKPRLLQALQNDDPHEMDEIADFLKNDYFRNEPY